MLLRRQGGFIRREGGFLRGRVLKKVFLASFGWVLCGGTTVEEGPEIKERTTRG